MKKVELSPLQQPDKIINYWKKEPVAVAFIVIFGIGYNISAILGPIYQGKLLDALLRRDSLHAIVSLAIIFVLLIASIQLMRHLKRFYTRRFANSTSATMRLMIYNNIMYKSYIDLQHENTGDLMTRALADVDLCVDGMRKFTTEVFDTGVLMSAYFVTMLYYDVKITIQGALFIPAAMLIAEKLKNLDSMTEERIVSVLQKASSAHTVLSISHRLSSMIASDIVVILENGRVKNAGSPEMLLQNDDWYRSHVALEKLTWR